MPDPRDDDTADRLIGDARTVRELFDLLPAPVAGVEVPGDYRVVAANGAYRTLIGREGFVGRSLSALMPELMGQRLFGVLDRVFASGEPETIREWRIQIPTETGPGDILYIDCAVIPQLSADGEVTRLLAFVQNVTDSVADRKSEERRADTAERRLEEASDVIEILQRNLLPPGLPILPGLQIAGSYLPADAETAGGDWFDAVPLPDGRTALVIGDVVGHGVAASAAMGQLRAVLEDRLDHSGDIAEALAAADRLAGRLPAARAATVCVAAVDPAGGAVTYCTAGHPPPLLIASGGDGRYLPSSGGGPLGTGSAFPLAHDRLGVGDHLVLYSDGIIERPGVDVSAGTVEFARAAADVAADRALREEWLSAVDRVTTQTIELLVRETGHADDITLLAAQRTGLPAPLRMDERARPAVIPSVRRALDDWLHGLGTRAEDAILLRHAVGELVTNVVEHAYGSPPGHVRVRAEATGRGSVEIEVADDGRWREHRREPDLERGRGLAMAGDFADDLRVDAESAGTTATIRHRLTRPARLLTAGDVTPPPAPAKDLPELLLILDQPSERAPRIRMDGPVDATTSEQLREELRMRTRGGTGPLTVDLTGVTHLASAGVAVLYEAEARTGAPLLLYAPAGSPAQHVMALVALPHTTTDPG
ncbi:STAS domain-containing protein [Actinomadura darangshiensis]|uniref:STAS domain-containing protein n=1 Tax=Actinomadura darangshiensis TaxID=705336 RepID=A0A4R5BPL9_9ACTN|nr:SpoIIE family protein phosphatase [Actinomadura darangshiensis]TDD85884.1 STAS domain-containing protein [Actinomadura darangshiensis]